MPDTQQGAITATDAARVRQLLAWLSLAAAALTLIIIVASATMRHAQAGLSCTDWPDCYARAAEAAGVGAPEPSLAVRVARLAHRIAAAGVSVAILGLLVVAWTGRSPQRRVGYWAAAALVVVVALAVLGTRTAGARLPAVALSNLLGGYTLLAALVAVHAASLPAPTVPRGARWLAGAAVALVLVQTAVGGLISAQFAGLACPGFPGCGDAVSAFASGDAWNPLRVPVVVDARIAAPEGAAGLHLVHRVCGLVVVVLALVTAAWVRRARPGLARALVAVSAVGAGLGIVTAVGYPALATVVAHNACAALLLALLVRAAVRPAAA
ncbi:MAG: COX15/CtaA family protein [Burkholderiales bacterium]|nr:COX15/CtaA family protein [Burkholderiales bacterium]